MARSFDYNHPNYSVVRQHAAPSDVAGVTAGGNFRVHTASILRAAHIVVTSAGATSAAIWSVLKGATTIGSFTAGVLSNGTTRTLTLNSTLAAMTDLVTVVGVATTGASVAVVYEHYPVSRADFS